MVFLPISGDESVLVERFALWKTLEHPHVQRLVDYEVKIINDARTLIYVAEYVEYYGELGMRFVVKAALSIAL